MQSRKIAIFTSAANGFGDLIFASRLTNYIRENSDYEVDMFAEDDDVNKLNSLGIEANHLQKYHPNDYRQVMIGPGIFSLPDRMLAKFSGKEVMIISEYDYDNYFNLIIKELEATNAKLEQKIKITKIRAGFTKDAHGILIEPLLIPENKTFDADLTQLINTKLKALLKPSSEHEVNGLIYSSVLPWSIQPQIFAARAVLNEHITRYNLIVISSQRDNFNNLIHGPGKLVNLLDGGDFDLLQFVDVDNDVTTTIPINPGADKKDVDAKIFRIIFIEKVRHIDMLRLQKIVGQELTAITGDQSLSEAISKGCIFRYIIRGVFHKEDLLKELTAIAFTLGLENVANYIADIDGNNLPMFYDKKFEEDFISFCAYIRKNYNLGQFIVEYLQSLDLDYHQAENASWDVSEGNAKASSTQFIRSILRPGSPVYFNNDELENEYVEEEEDIEVSFLPLHHAMSQLGLELKVEIRPGNQKIDSEHLLITVYSVIEFLALQKTLQESGIIFTVLHKHKFEKMLIAITDPNTDRVGKKDFITELQANVKKSLILARNEIALENVSNAIRALNLKVNIKIKYEAVLPHLHVSGDQRDTFQVLATAFKDIGIDVRLKQVDKKTIMIIENPQQRIALKRTLPKLLQNQYEKHLAIIQRAPELKNEPKTGH